VAKPTRPREIGRSTIDQARLAEEKREPEDEQKVADDRPDKRSPHDLGQAVGDGDDRNDQLRRVTERRVQETTDARTGVARQVVRRLPDQPREREQRYARKHEQRQLADRIEPIQNDHQRPEQQQQC